MYWAMVSLGFFGGGNGREFYILMTRPCATFAALKNGGFRGGEESVHIEFGTGGGW